MSSTTYSSCLAPEPAFLLGHLRFPVQLIYAAEPHEQVDNHQVVVYRVDLRRIPRPYESRACDCKLLVGGDVFGGSAEIADVGDGDEPFEGGRPEENGEGACWVQQQGAGLSRPRQGHHCFLDG